MRPSTLSLLVLAPSLLAGCASFPLAEVGTGDPPRAFHDTRMLSAMIAGEDAKLEREFGVKPPPIWPERIVAGAVLPFTVATETVFFPVFAAIKAFTPARPPERSSQ